MELEDSVKKLLKGVPQPCLADFVEQNLDFIARNSAVGEELKQKWARIFGKATQSLNIVIRKSRVKPNWNSVASRMAQLAEKNPDIKPQTTSPKSSSTTCLKFKITTEDKKTVSANLQCLNKSKFWSLQEPKIIVDQAIIDFAEACNYHHPSQSLILDIGDNNWEKKFTATQLDYLDQFGQPLFPILQEDWTQILHDISELKTPLQAYEYGRSLKHDPIKEPMKAWIAVELQNAAKLFFYADEPLNMDSMLESDQLYEVWGFLKTMVKGHRITAKGSEGSSRANAEIMNKKRTISAIEPACNRRMGRKIDVIYSAARKGIGCIEIGKDDNQSKEMKDGMLKMPLIMHDMLIDLSETEELLRHAQVLGYVINGHKISMMIMDSPEGFVARIRRSSSLEFPSCSEDFISKIVPIFKLALSGLEKMQNMRNMLVATTKNLTSMRSSNDWKLPPTFTPSSLTSSSSSSSLPSSSSSMSSSKKQKAV